MRHRGENSVAKRIIKNELEMYRFIQLLAVVVLCGCAPSGAKQSAGAFRWDKEENVILLDTRIRPKQIGRFDIGRGSITIETLTVTENRLTFRYTREIEGGYTVYECRVPISPSPVKFKIDPGGTPGETSFDLSKCKVIRKGNVHFNSNPANKAVNPSGGPSGF